LKRDKTKGRHPNQASVDRTDSSKGYVTDNIQFVSLIANYAKSSFDVQQLFEFCKAVALVGREQHGIF
jgi:hypothetical protein